MKPWLAPQWFCRLLEALLKRLTPKPDLVSPLREEISALRRIVAERVGGTVEQANRKYLAILSDLAEARQMAGIGPWSVSPAAMRTTEALLKEAQLSLRETQADGSIGATGDINLMLNTVQWRRDLQLSFLEFSRWGIQQIILICRLYYIKNPIFRRLCDVIADYVFARGVEVSTSDPNATAVWDDFVQRNKSVFGQVALVEAQKAKAYDGNLFWCFFADSTDSGQVDCRRIDATEIQEIVVNPEDRTEAWFYRRMWTQPNMDSDFKSMGNVDQERWYPSLAYSQKRGRAAMPEAIRNIPVERDAPIYHRRCGAVAQWLFGCPEFFPMVDWCRESRLLLEACASIKQSLMQIGMIVTTKGGQQAISGIKQQLGTTVGPNTNLWDQNPPAVPGATMVSGPGTDIKAFDSSKGGGDPKDADPYIRMCVIVAGVPETFVSILGNSNLATATSLDRPTETNFLKKQEEWREDLTTICGYVLGVSAGAPSGRLRESAGVAKLQIQECRRRIGSHGEVVYEAFSKDPSKLEIRVNFPNIREGDTPALVDACIKAGTLGAGGGQVLGIDEKALVRRLYDLVGIENGDELAEAQYPEATYKTDRTLDSDIPANIEATIHAITLGNRQGQALGIDEKTGMIKLMTQLGIANPEKIANQMYPPGEYDPDRTKEVEPPPASLLNKADVGQPITPTDGEQPETVPAEPAPDAVTEALRRVHEATGRVARRWTPNSR